MATAKDEVQRLLVNLPDDASLEDIQYQIYVMQKVRRGLKELDEGNTVSHEEVAERMAKWLKP